MEHSKQCIKCWQLVLSAYEVQDSIAHS